MTIHKYRENSKSSQRILTAYLSLFIHETVWLPSSVFTNPALKHVLPRKSPGENGSVITGRGARQQTTSKEPTVWLQI